MHTHQFSLCTSLWICTSLELGNIRHWCAIKSRFRISVLLSSAFSLIYSVFSGLGTVRFSLCELMCCVDSGFSHALVDFYRPDLVDMERVQIQSNRENLEQAFEVAERLGVTRLLDAEGESYWILSTFSMFSWFLLLTSSPVLTKKFYLSLRCGCAISRWKVSNHLRVFNIWCLSQSPRGRRRDQCHGKRTFS